MHREIELNFLNHIGKMEVHDLSKGAVGLT